MKYNFKQDYTRNRGIFLQSDETARRCDELATLCRDRRIQPHLLSPIFTRPDLFLIELLYNA